MSRSGTLTVAGLTTAAATNVTVNSQSATLHDDATFAKSGLNLSDGDNTFTATATDALGRNASDSVTVNLPATVTCDYDDNGNLTDAGSLDYGYDDANQLTSITESGEWKTEFVYDGLGRMRVRKEYDWNGSAWVQTEEHRYIYDRMLALQERDGANVPRVSYTRGPDLSGSLQGAGGIGGLLARTDHGSGTHAYYHADGMGNVTALLDEDEQVVARYAYDPFGNLQGLSGPLAEVNEYRYSSKLWHAASGLYAYGYRFYSPSLQRWLNQDPLGEAGGLNLYGFVQNSPTVFGDPWGLYSFGECLDIAGSYLYGLGEGLVNEVIGVGKLGKAVIFDLGKQITLTGFDIVEAHSGGDAFESAIFTGYYSQVLAGRSDLQVAGELGLQLVGYRYGNSILEGIEYGAATGDWSQFSQQMGQTGFSVGYALGGELSFGENFRIAPFGNRTGHPTGRYPHYHRRVPDPKHPGQAIPGGSLKRHRPWDTKCTDKSVWDRF